jgi:hypothetical protein
VRNHTGALPLRMRLGGNSMDDATFVQGMPPSPLIDVTNANANPNDIPVDFGPALWAQMAAVADTIGGGEYVIGLSLHNSSDPRAADIPGMASSAKQTLGDRIDTFLLGNVRRSFMERVSGTQRSLFCRNRIFTEPIASVLRVILSRIT